MIENFPNPRRMHCETGVTVNMMQYYGYDITEQMVFGIGGGMFFIFFPLLKSEDIQSTPVIMRSRATDIIRHFSKRMNLGYHEMTFGNNRDKAEQELDKLVAQGIPVGVVVNIIELKYLNDLGFNHNFNGHHLTVVGKEGDQYIVADTDEHLLNDDYVTIPEATMRSVRFKSGLAAPHGRMFYFDELPSDYAQTVDLQSAIIAGMTETCKNMLSIPMPWFGCKGMHYLAKQMRKWPKKYPKDKIDYLLYEYYRLIEQAGTGGAGYRYIYSDFLKNAADLFQDSTLEESSAMMRKAADTWRAFTIKASRHIKHTGVSIDEMADIIDEAGNCEYQTFTNIKKNFLSKHK